MMKITDQVALIEFEAQQLTDNVFALVKAPQKLCANIGTGGSLTAIKQDIRKLRRDLLKLSKSLPDSAWQAWEVE